LVIEFAQYELMPARKWRAILDIGYAAIMSRTLLFETDAAIGRVRSRRVSSLRKIKATDSRPAADFAALPARLRIGSGTAKAILEN
jgi:hypothetical protein